MLIWGAGAYGGGVAGSGAGSAMDGHELLRDLFALYRREGLTGVWSIGYGVTCSGRAGARVRVADYTQLERIIATTGEFLERTGTRFEAGFTHMILVLPAPYPSGAARWVADEIIGAF